MSKKISLLVTVSGNQEIISHGTVNDSAFEVLRKLFNPALKGVEWNAVLYALAAGDSINWENAKLAIDQLTIAGASGKYLDKRASDVGIKRPPNVGMSDELFRRLTVLENSEKLSQEAILDILEVFYGKDAVSAAITTNNSEPYRLQDDDDLRFLLDEQEDITVIFKREEFARLGEATAVEVAAAITRACISAKSQGFAIPVIDPETGIKKVKIYSAKAGLSSSVRIIGGQAQTVLQFPESIFTTSGGSPFANWDISLSPTTAGNIRFTETSGIYDLQNLVIGDLVYIYGNEFAPSNNQGTFEVKDVLVEYTPGLVQWFEITNPTGGTDTVSQILFENLMFFRPVRHTIYDQPRHVIVAQTQPGLNIEIPATTLAVGRKPGLAAYLESLNQRSISNISRVDDLVTTTTNTAHDMVAGNQFFIDAVEPDIEFISSPDRWSVVLPPRAVGTPSPDFIANVAVGTTDKSILTTISEADTYEGVFHKVLRLPEGQLMIVGGETQVAGVSTTIPNPVIFEITSDTTVANERQQTYKWTRLSGDTLTIGRRDFGASVLDDGRVVLTGGDNSTDALVVAPVNIWNIIVYNNTPGDNYMVSGIMPVALAAHGQCVMDNGKVLVSGGWTVGWDDLLTASYTFDPNSSVWTTVASMNDARVEHKLVHIDNRVLAIGGRHSDPNPNVLDGTILNTCEIYNTAGDYWTRTGSMSNARFAFGTVTLPDGRIMVVGGLGYNPSRTILFARLKSTEIYDPNTGFWTPGPPTVDAHDFPTVELIGNSVFVAGGGYGGFNVTSVEILDLETMRWKKTADTLLSPPLVQSQGGLAGPDTLVVIGGIDDGESTAKQNNIMVQNQSTVWNGGLNTLGTVENVISPTQFTYKTLEHVGWTSSLFGILTPFKALPDSDGAQGPFVWDLQEGVSITSVNSTLNMEIEQDQSYNILELVDATVFPDQEGFLVFNFGYDNQTAPVRYTGRLSGTELALDAGFTFPKDIDIGASAILLKDRNPFVPEVNDFVGDMWATDSASGRIAAQQAIDETVAAGIDVNVKVIYPGDRGMGAEGFPVVGGKLSDVFEVFAGNDIDSEVKKAQEGP